MNVISFFAGCGGLDLGFEQAGFHVIWANESDTAVRETYEKNHPETKFVLCDINKLSPDDLPECDGFIGGPPCQPWSVAGKQLGLDDNRGKLFLTYIYFIRAKRPKFFLIENVKGILDNKFDTVFHDILNKLESAGYDIKWNLLDAANYSVPQNRERVFLIGFRKDLSINYEFPKPTCSQPVTLKQAIGDITEYPIQYNSNDKVSPNSTRSNHDVLTSVFGPFYYRGNRRRGWQQPSFTIHATPDNIQLHPSSPKMLYYGHEKWSFQKEKISEYRRLSVRECARIQTFPDSFVFYSDNIKNNYKMIGNAVPPQLGKRLAESILEVLSNKKINNLSIPSRNNPSDSCTLVGYFKDKNHYDLILKNLLYYVRSDGRTGSIFKETCEITPRFLFLHHKENVKIFELDSEEPLLTDSSFLNKCGFNCYGNRYLCFKLKSMHEVNIKQLVGYSFTFIYDKNKYAPYFTTINKLIKMD